MLPDQSRAEWPQADTRLSERRQSGPDEGNVRDGDEGREMPIAINPHYSSKPSFLPLAGVTASVTQQFVLYRLTHVQVEYLEHRGNTGAPARKVKGQSRPDEKDDGASLTQSYNVSSHHKTQPSHAAAATTRTSSLVVEAPPVIVLW